MELQDTPNKKRIINFKPGMDDLYLIPLFEENKTKILSMVQSWLLEKMMIHNIIEKTNEGYRLKTDLTLIQFIVYMNEITNTHIWQFAENNIVDTGCCHVAICCDDNCSIHFVVSSLDCGHNARDYEYNRKTNEICFFDEPLMFFYPDKIRFPKR